MTTFGRSVARMFRATYSTPTGLMQLIVVVCLGLSTALASPVLQAHPAAGPNLTDLGGWNQPGYYSTLQTADVNGDGQDEIVARGKDGLHVWELIKGAWIETSRLPALSDAAGWNAPSRYQTIQFAHLQPHSRQADLVARSSDGIHVWRYNQASGSWTELGVGVTRPFGDEKVASTGTDWTTPAHYTNILVGDLDHDGVDELVGRGERGLEVYRWEAATNSWQGVSQSGPLADEDGFGNRSSYFSLALVSLNGKAYVVARTSGGMQLLEWRNGSWHTASAEGPFADGSCADAPELLTSVRTYVDDRGQLWVFGLVPGGRTQASIAVYRWNPRASRWTGPSMIPLSGRGWTRPSQYLTLRAADLWRDGKVEILARGADGMHVYQQFRREEDSEDDAPGFWKQVQVIREMSDPRGYGLASSYYTIQTLRIHDRDTNSDTDGRGPGTVLLGRAPGGVEIYHNVGGRLTQATPLPAWQNANQQHAYALISQGLTSGGTDDIRTIYYGAANDYSYWKQEEFDLRHDYQTPPAGFPSPGDWNYVYQQLDLEFSYVAAVRAWFQNNTTLTDYIFNAAALQLTQVQNDETIQDSSGGSGSQVALEWAELVAQIVSQIIGVLDAPEAGLVTSLLEDGMQAAANIESGGKNNVQVAVDAIASQVGAVHLQYTTQNAQQMTQYVTDWTLLRKIGVGSTGSNPQYEWGEGTTVNELAAAETSGAIGQLLWMYKTVSNPAWHVYWCFPQEWPFGGCLANSSYPSQYIYNQYDNGWTHFTAYTVIKAYRFPYPSFSALDRLTHMYGVNINDLLADCDGWNLDDPANPNGIYPNSCRPASSSLQGDRLPKTLAALSALHDRLKRDESGGSADLTPALRAAIDYVQKHVRYEPAPYGGAPNRGDIALAKSTNATRYVDKTVPMHFLYSFITTVQNQEMANSDSDTAKSYLAEAYEVIGALNDDDVALADLGPPNN